ncbi:hypothetical protein [Lacipirellula sp.]|uniref:hypothetical protein n=1 Tax=Lacipirellula sp. TaxID=2691419 RepID=UPI003D0AECF0
MRRKLLLWSWAAIALYGTPASAATTTEATRGAGAAELDGLIATNDLLTGLIATELPGDHGWHPGNPASGNSANPNGLAAFTDGDGYLSGVTGLLNDFPPTGTPTKKLQYNLPGPTNIQQIGILSGNLNNADGRIFSTSVIRYSTNGGSSFSLLGYFESTPLGSINNETGVPGATEDHAIYLKIFDDASEVLVAGVTNLQVDLYAVDNTGGQYRDPFDGVNPFTSINDGLTAAFVAPLIWEIDVIGAAATVNSADFDGNNVVDGKDFLVWQRGFGAVGTGSLATGDANGDHDVDGDDLMVWKNQFGTAGIAAVPEPSALALTCCGLLAPISRRRNRARASV